MATLPSSFVFTVSKAAIAPEGKREAAMSVSQDTVGPVSVSVTLSKALESSVSQEPFPLKPGMSGGGVQQERVFPMTYLQSGRQPGSPLPLRCPPSSPRSKTGHVQSAGMSWGFTYASSP